MIQQAGPGTAEPLEVSPIPLGALDHPVFFDPARAQEALLSARRQRSWRLVTLGISLAISAALWWFYRESGGSLTWGFMALIFVLSGIPLIRSMVQVLVTRRDVAGVGQGLALGVGRAGLYLRGTFVPWSEVGFLRAATGRLGASSVLTVVTRGGQTLTLPLDYLSSYVAAIDNAVRALSGGRVWLDLSGLDL